MKGDAKLLFVETFLLGDLIYLGALLNVVRAERREAHIEVLASTATQGFPFFDPLNITVHHFDFPWSRIGWRKEPAQFIRAGVDLRRQFGQRFRDYVILDPRGDVRHALTAHLLRPKRFIKYRSGANWRDAWRGASPRHTFISRVEFLRQIAEECGLPPRGALSWPWLTDLRSDDLAKASRTVLLAPESSLRLNYWKSERWKLLGRWLRREGWRVTLIVHRGDAVSPVWPDDFDEVWQGPLVDLGRLVGCSQAVIAVDSFIGHLSAAIGVPVVSLFGRQLPEHWRPWGEGTAVVVADGYPCRPCDLRRCVRPHESCMDAIQVEQVVRAFQMLIADRTNQKLAYENKTH